MFKDQDSWEREYVENIDNWTFEEAARLFARIPLDNRTYLMPPLQLSIVRRKMDAAYIHGKLSLIEKTDSNGKTILTAPKEIFLIWAHENKLDTLLSPYLKQIASSATLKVNNTIADPILSLNNENLNNFMTGKITRERQKKFSQEGARASKAQADKNAKPYLEKALSMAQAKPDFYSANSLARNVLKKTSNPNITLGTLRKRFRDNSEIKSLLKETKTNRS